MSRIFLIGMPGSGKSSIARLWGISYNWQVTDMDTELARQYGSIADIFTNQGEAFFREKEHKLLQSLIAAGPQKSIIATGGGTPCFFNNIDLMKEAGCVVYIQAGIPLLLSRLQRSSIVRPLLAGDQQQRLRELLSAREPIYNNAHFSYPSESLTEATFAEIIDRCTNQRL